MNAMKPEYEISNEFAVKIMEDTRKGKFTGGRMSPETEKCLQELGISDHWITQMKHTYYLKSRAELVAMLLDELTLAWYEINS